MNVALSVKKKIKNKEKIIIIKSIGFPLGEGVAESDGRGRTKKNYVIIEPKEEPE